MSGRGNEPVLEYTLTTESASGESPKNSAQVPKTFVRARVVKTRPVPENAPEPENFMTHQIEYIVGGTGVEWVKLDEAKKTVRQRMGWLPMGHEGEPYFVVKYKVLECESATQPAPGQYGILVEKKGLFAEGADAPHIQQSGFLGQTGKRWPGTYEKRPQMPEPASYMPSSIRTAKSSPSFGFGSAPRLPTVRREQRPEPGVYQPRNCWDANSVTMRSRPKPKVYHAEVGMEPTAYDSLKGLRLTKTEEPAWRLNTTGSRSKVVDDRLPEKVGPGTYDCSMRLVKERSPAVVYTRPTGLAPEKKPPHDRPLSHFSVFCEEGK